jgi:HAD superfamily hydrolase (TIGR01509 family)
MLLIFRGVVYNRKKDRETVIQMKAFIFDMDGVIIDSEQIHAEVKMQTFRHFGLPFDKAELVHYTGRTSQALFDEVIAAQRRTDVTADEMVAYKHGHYLEILQGDACVKPIAGIVDLLDGLKKKRIPTALASSGGRVVIDAVLEKLELSPYFQSVLSGADLPKSKPDPTVYRISAERLGVEPPDCVVLEDAASGIAAAKAAGMYCIAYHNPNSGEQDLSQADRIVDRINEIDIDFLL